MRRPVNLWFALLGLGTSKLRAALTVLGIIIGVGAVIMIVSLGNGLKRSTIEQMEVWGRGNVEIRPIMMRYYGEPMPVEAVSSDGRATVVRGRAPTMPQSQGEPLTMDDVRALELLATRLNGVSPQFQTNATVVYRGRQVPVWEVLGVTPEWTHVHRREMKSGRFFTEEDEYLAAPVAVLDEIIVKQFFGEQRNPIGEALHVTVNNEMTMNLTIVGVLRSDREYSRTGNTLLVPLRTAQMRMNTGAKDQLSMIAVRVDAREPEARKHAVAEINTILRARHKLAPGAAEDYQIQDTLEYSEEMTRISDIMTLVLSLIAGISLVVGSIGLMNIMLVSVSERTWEIGLRRAIGAQRSDILSQFLGEAVLLSLMGGLIGMGLGILGSFIVEYFVQDLQGFIKVTPDIVAIALTVSTVVGVASGSYPAWRAARLQPTDALRHMA